MLTTMAAASSRWRGAGSEEDDGSLGSFSRIDGARASFRLLVGRAFIALAAAAGLLLSDDHLGVAR